MPSPNAQRYADMLRQTAAPAVTATNAPPGGDIDAATNRMLNALRMRGFANPRISSGYRSPEENAATPGASPTSWHLQNRARDIVWDGMTGWNDPRLGTAVEIAQRIGFGEIKIDEHGTGPHIHIANPTAAPAPIPNQPAGPVATAQPAAVPAQPGSVLEITQRLGQLTPEQVRQSLNLPPSGGPARVTATRRPSFVEGLEATTPQSQQALQERRQREQIIREGRVIPPVTPDKGWSQVITDAWMQGVPAAVNMYAEAALAYRYLPLQPAERALYDRAVPALTYLADATRPEMVNQIGTTENQRLVSDALQSLPSSLAASVPGALVGGPVGAGLSGGAVMGFSQFNQTMDQLMPLVNEGKVDRETAYAIAAFDGASEAGTEGLSDMISFGLLGAAAKAGRPTLLKIIGNLAGIGTAEATTEGINQLLKDTARQMFGVMSPTNAEKWANAWYAFKVGGVAGLIMGGGGTIIAPQVAGQPAIPALPITPPAVAAPAIRPAGIGAAPTPTPAAPPIVPSTPAPAAPATPAVARQEGESLAAYRARLAQPAAPAPVAPAPAVVAAPAPTEATETTVAPLPAITPAQRTAGTALERMATMNDDQLRLVAERAATASQEAQRIIAEEQARREGEKATAEVAAIVDTVRREAEPPSRVTPPAAPNETREPWQMTREEFFDNPDEVRKYLGDTGAGGFKVSYEYINPSGAGPFRGSMVFKKKPSRGDEIAAPFGSARVTAVQAAKTASVPLAERYEEAKAVHRKSVETALREGKSVPAEVLADYPDLQSAAPRAKTVAVKPQRDLAAIAERTGLKPATVESFYNAIDNRSPNELIRHATTGPRALRDLALREMGIKPSSRESVVKQRIRDWANGQEKATLRDGLAGRRRNERGEAISPLEVVIEVGRRVYNALGPIARNLRTFSNRMREIAGELWEQVRPHVQAAFETIHREATRAMGPSVRGAARIATGEAVMPEGPTGIKEEAVTQQRAERGLPPAEKPPTMKHDVVDTEAKLIMDENPDAADALVNDIITEPRAASNVEMAIMLNRMTQASNELRDKDTRMVAAQERGDVDAARALAIEVDQVGELLETIELAAKLSGTETARGLEYRRQMMRENYTLDRMVIRRRAAQGGTALTNEQITDTRKRQEEIAAAYNALEQRLAEAEKKNRELETQLAIKKLITEERTKNITEKRKGNERNIPEEKKRILAALKNKVSDQEISIDHLGKYVQELAKRFVAEGIKEANPLVDAVHDVIKDVIPGITRRETMDAISGYGEFKQLSQDEIDKQFRDIKGQLQQMAKLDDMAAGRAPKATGWGREEKSDEYRRLTALVNEAKKKGGFIVTDPVRQLKSALGAIKTRLRNSIADLDFQIATQRKIVKQKVGVAYDAEAESLRSQRDKLKQQFDDLFGKPEMTDEQRVKIAMGAVERSIADLEQRIANRDIGPRSRESRTPNTPELEAARARRDALREELKTLQLIEEATNPTRFDVPKDIIILRALDKSIAEYERRIREGDFTSAEKTKALTTPAIETAREMRDEIRRQYNELKNAQNKPSQDAIDAKRIDQMIDRTIAAIANLEGRIASGDVSAKQKPEGPTSPELEAYRQLRDELNKTINQMRRDAKPKPSPDEIANRRMQTYMANRTADILDRLARQDFAPRVKKEYALTPETVAAKEKYEQLKKDFQDAIDRDKYNRLPWYGKTLFQAFRAAGVPRSIMSSIDFSAPFRQGAFFATRPQFYPALLRMFAAGYSETNYNALMYEIKNHPNYGLMKRAGLALTELDGQLSRREEDYQSDLAEKIPGAGRFVRGSGRAYTGFLNKLRADVFNDLIAKAEMAGYSRKDAEFVKALADFINTATGRGSLTVEIGGHKASLEGAAVALNQLFFSPRLIASRLKLLNPLYYSQQPKFVRDEALKSLFGSIALGTTFVGMMALAGADVDKDPLSTDFMKVKIGNTRIDPWAGFQQYIVAIVRVLQNQKVTQRGETVTLGESYGAETSGDIAMRLFSNKLSPLAGLIKDLVNRKDMMGQPVTITSAIRDRMIPMSLGAMYETGKNDPSALPLSILGVFGMGVQSYAPKVEQMKNKSGYRPVRYEQAKR